MAITDDGLRCFFCEQAMNPETFAKEYELIVDPMICQDCGRQSIIEVAEIFVCANCGLEYRELKRCSYCDETFIPEEETNTDFCSSCYDRMQDEEEESYYNSIN